MANFVGGASDRGRTCTSFLIVDFESTLSANSNTEAYYTKAVPALMPIAPTRLLRHH